MGSAALSRENPGASDVRRLTIGATADYQSALQRLLELKLEFAYQLSGERAGVLGHGNRVASSRNFWASP